MNIFVHFSNHLSMIYLIIVNIIIYYIHVHESMSILDAIYSERVNRLKVNIKVVKRTI